jgi:hypothetical protein
MSDAVALDLFIQDFVATNKLLNQHYSWPELVNRRFQEDGLLKVFQFQSGGAEHFAVGRCLALPDADWFRIELTRSVPPAEHRFDCLRMMQLNTHTGLTVETVGDVILVKLTTRHRGLINVVFMIHPCDSPDSLPDPFLVV